VNKIASNGLTRSILGGALLLGALLCGVFFQQSLVSAALPPSTMNFQGRLTDNSGTARADGQYNMQFRIFSASTGGTALWTETRQTTSRVQLTNGLFSTQLGEVTPLPASVFNATNLYFEITMANPATATCSTASCATWEAAMTPRNKLATSAYAFNSSTLNGKFDTDFAAATGSANYIQNQSATPQAASFNVSGTGRVGGAFTAAGTASVTGALTANSTALFKNSSNSTTAFRIQDSSSATLFSVDTTNKRINVGSSTADSNAYYFVLDAFSGPADPTGSIPDGATYYNNSLSKFRCRIDGLWANCDGQPSATTKTANYTAKRSDIVLADASAGSFTVTLPNPWEVNGATISVKKITAPNSVTVTSSTNIDNLSSEVITTQWQSQDYYSDGIKWYRI